MPNKALLKRREKLRLSFWRPKNTMKRKCYVVSGYKQRNKVFLVYLKCDCEQHRYGWCLFKLKLKKTVDKTYLETSKTHLRCRSCFRMLKCLQWGNNWAFRLLQETTMVQWMYSTYEKPQNNQIKRSTMVTKLKAKYQWCFSSLKCKRTGPP